MENGHKHTFSRAEKLPLPLPKKFFVNAESDRKKFLHEPESDRKKYFVISEIVKIIFSVNAEVIRKSFCVIPDCSQKRKSSRRQEEFQAPS